MFRLLEDAPADATVMLDGRPVRLPAGENLAAALLAAGIAPARITPGITPVGGMPRLAFCMMGVCFDCLAVVDGVPNRQTCLEQVRDGMTVCRQEGAR